MGRVVKNAQGLSIHLNEADPEEAMRQARREYYTMPTPEQSLFDELIHLGIDQRRFMREVEFTEELTF